MWMSQPPTTHWSLASCNDDLTIAEQSTGYYVPLTAAAREIFYLICLSIVRDGELRSVQCRTGTVEYGSTVTDLASF